MAAQAPPPAHLRQEIFALGGRHLGDALGGAKRELEDAQISPQRRKVLEAVVRHLESSASARPRSPAATPQRSPAPAGGWRAVAYGGAFIVSAVWAAATLLRTFG